MLRRIGMFVGATVLAMAALFVVAGRSIGEFGGYVRATADTTVEDLAEKLPDEVQDRKVELDLQSARQDLIDHQVNVSLSQSQIDQLHEDIEGLRTSVERRKRLLAEAYPVLNDAVKSQKTKVSFASTEFSLADFQREIDKLLARQEREGRQLQIKQEGLGRLEKSADEGERVIQEMREALEGTYQEFEVLKSRRELAQVEAETLDMIAAVSGKQINGTEIANGVNKLRNQVEELEARNDAQRTLAPAIQDEPGELNRNWSRLERLRTYHESVAAVPASTEEESTLGTVPTPSTGS